MFCVFPSKRTNQYIFKGNFECWFLLLHKPALDLHSALWLLTAKEELTGCGTSRPTDHLLLEVGKMDVLLFPEGCVRQDHQVYCVPHDFKCFCCVDNLLYRCYIALVEDVFSSSLQSCHQQIFLLFAD